MAKTSTIYLDYAAATPLDGVVIDAMRPYGQTSFYNPSATYLSAQAVRRDLEHARGRIAGVLGAHPATIIFTAGATEANNLALFGVAASYPKGEIISTVIEHESVLRPLEELKKREHQVHLVAPTTNGIISASDIATKITDKTVLVSVMYANNEIGTIQPLHEVGRVIQKVRRDRFARGITLPLHFHSDAAQAANYLDLHVARLGVDLLSLNGSKIYGPKQSGILYVAKQVRLTPLIFGGGQEHGLRSGTENVAACIGLATALEITQKMHLIEAKRLAELQKLGIELITNKIDGASINGSRNDRLPNNIHVTFPGTDNERLIMLLDENGIQCAAGSACSASHEESSHVLRGLGLSDQEARSSIRLTMGRGTTEPMLRHACQELIRLVPHC